MKGFHPVLLTALLLALLLTASQSVQAGLYKWVDDAGKTHYSQIPPAGRTTQEINPANSAANPEPETDTPDPNDVNMTAERSAKQSETPTPQLLAESCDALRRHITLLETNNRVRIRNDSTGKLTVLSEEEKQARINQYKDQLKTSCQDPK